MTLDRLIQVLKDADLDFSAFDVLDSIWLATRKRDLSSAMSARGPRSLRPPGGGGQDGGAESGRERDERGASRHAQTNPGKQASDRSKGAQSRSETLLYSTAVSSGDRTVSASAVATPAARALPNRLALLRALRPLRQRWPSKINLELDEEATAGLTADLGGQGEGRLYPVFRPRLERWFECDLVLEHDDAVEIWRDQLRVFAQTLRDSGAFREVRSWRLRLDPAEPNDIGRAMLETPAGARVAARRLGGGIRRLILFASHGASHHWRTGAYGRLLASWSGQSVVGLLHLLPRDMWRRTALGEPQAECATSRPGAPASALNVEAYWWMPGPDPDGPDTVRLPVLDFDASTLGNWAAMTMARGRRAPAFLIDRTAVRKPPPPADDPALIERRLNALRESAAESFWLAVILSASPFTIGVAHLIEEARFGTVDNRRLAELFLSGLIRTLTPERAMPVNREPWYAVLDSAKPLLLRSMRASEAETLSREAMDRVSRHLADIEGRGATIASFTPDSEGKYQIPEWAQPFARMAVSLRTVARGTEDSIEPLARIEKELSAASLRRVAALAANGGAVTPDDVGPEIWRRLDKAGLFETSGNSLVEAVLPDLIEMSERSPLRDFRILWVDDIPSNNAHLTALFRGWGAIVKEALSTEEALEMLAGGFAAELVISDMGRGDEMNAGLDLLERLPAVTSAPAMIFADVFPQSPARRRRAYAAGAVACTRSHDQVTAIVLALARGDPVPGREEELSALSESGPYPEDDLRGEDKYQHAAKQGREALQRGDFDEAERWFLRMWDAADDLDEEYFREGASSALGDVAYAREDFQEARVQYARALFHAKRSQEGEGIAEAHLELGKVAERLLELVVAESEYQEALNAHFHWGDIELRALSGLARVSRLRGDFEAATGWYRQELEKAGEDDDDVSFRLEALTGLAEVAVERRAFGEAIDWYQSALSMAAEAGEQAAAMQTYLGLGHAAIRMGDMKLAESAFRDALGRSEEMGDRNASAVVFDALAGLLANSGRKEEAEPLYRRALAIFEELENLAGAASTLLNLGRLLVERGDRAQGAVLLVSVMDLADKIEAPRTAAEASIELSRLAADIGETITVRGHLQRALTLAERLGDEGVAASVREEIERVEQAATVEATPTPPPPAASPPPSPTRTARGAVRAVSQACIKLIQQFEGLAKKRPDGTVEAYPDPGTGGDPWTIGWGSTGPDVKKGTVWTQNQCDDRFAAQLAEFAEKIAKLIGNAPTTQAQFDALVSFAYNVGVANLSSSTLLKKHKSGDFKGAAAEFARWNKAAGKVLPGLVRRRAAEAALYLQLAT